MTENPFYSTLPPTLSNSVSIEIKLNKYGEILYQTYIQDTHGHISLPWQLGNKGFSSQYYMFNTNKILHTKYDT